MAHQFMAKPHIKTPPHVNYWRLSAWHPNELMLNMSLKSPFLDLVESCWIPIVLLNWWHIPICLCFFNTILIVYINVYINVYIVVFFICSNPHCVIFHVVWCWTIIFVVSTSTIFEWVPPWHSYRMRASGGCDLRQAPQILVKIWRNLAWLKDWVVDCATWKKNMPFEYLGVSI